MRAVDKRELSGTLFHRQPQETQEAFQAFEAYRDLGPGRSHAKVGSRLGKSTNLMDRWAARWSWEIRVVAWDAEVDRLAVIAVAKAKAEMTTRHINSAKALQFKAIERLAKMNADELKPGEVLDYFIEASKLERLAMGESTEKKEVGGEVKLMVAFVTMPGVEILDADNRASRPD